MSAPAGPVPAWLRWLHRVCCLTTALVIMLLAFAGLMLWLRFKPD